MMSVNGGYWGWGLAGIKPVRDSERRPFDLRDHGAVYRHEGPELRGGLSGRLHLRRRRPLHDQPRGMHRLRRLRTRVPRRSHLPRRRSPRRHGKLHHQSRQLLRIAAALRAYAARSGLRPTLVGTPASTGLSATLRPKGFAVSQVQLRPDPFAHRVPLRVEGGSPILPSHSETTGRKRGEADAMPTSRRRRRADERSPEGVACCPGECSDASTYTRTPGAPSASTTWSCPAGRGSSTASSKAAGSPPSFPSRVGETSCSCASGGSPWRPSRWSCRVVGSTRARSPSWRPAGSSSRRR